MFKSVTPQPFFPTIAWVHDLEDSVATRLNAQLAGDLDRMTAPRPPLTPGLTWQTEQNMHELEVFAELTALIKTAAIGVMDKMEIECDGPLITGCWANKIGRAHV